MSVSFPLPSSPHCDPRMIVLIVVDFAGRTHAMPVESEGKKVQKTRGGLPSKKSAAGARAWHVPSRFSARMVEANSTARNQQFISRSTQSAEYILLFSISRSSE